MDDIMGVIERAVAAVLFCMATAMLLVIMAKIIPGFV